MLRKTYVTHIFLTIKLLKHMQHFDTWTVSTVIFYRNWCHKNNGTKTFHSEMRYVDIVPPWTCTAVKFSWHVKTNWGRHRIVSSCVAMWVMMCQFCFVLCQQVSSDPLERIFVQGELTHEKTNETKILRFNVFSKHFVSCCMQDLTQNIHFVIVRNDILYFYTFKSNITFVCCCTVSHFLQCTIQIPAVFPMSWNFMTPENLIFQLSCWNPSTGNASWLKI